ncbi:MAG TPA: Ppx/GppA phosphatase family protein [Solirubrobacteraceae bacterium]|jgi:exopolyphosphatase/guanosine-5'-triphosphate,3'-diphosphate pyrophosphatase|nr:Ppx/GppA phosphatase family protein [Solirubrobacteraceae bacterium]
MQASERLAVIDLGSNSFRLVVFSATGRWWQRTDEIYEPVRIGEGMGATGRLGAEPMRRALATLDVFAHFCQAAGLEGGLVDAVATSAIRDAANSADFLALARERSQLAIRVLSREQEARYGYLAAVNSTTLSDGCVLDLGGGSLQLVRVVDRLPRDSGSWRLGSVRMTERFLAGPGPAKRRQLEDLRAHVAHELAQAPWLASAAPRIVGIGGTVRNLAVAAQRALGRPSNGVQGTTIERDVLDELVQRLAALPVAERSGVPGIKPVRADVILAGALVVLAVLDAGGFERLEVTEAGLREGVFFERHLAGDAQGGGGDLPGDGGNPAGDADRAEGVAREPLFADVRRASVLNLAARYHMDAAHTQHVAALALGMFDQLAQLGLHAGDPLERELLWAACVLHDIGMSVDYDDHHKHSRYLILNGGLPGFSPTEVAIVAQAARYHRKGMPEPGPLGPLFAEGDRGRLDRCAVLLRLAEDLERSRDQLVRDTVLSTRNGDVQLRLLADGESAVPRWAAGRESELFARAFHRGLAVVA